LLPGGTLSRSHPEGTTFRARGQNRKITKVESLTKQDKLVAYEAQADKNRTRSGIKVGPKGERILTEV
jgi:hypothetical protein